MAATLTTVEAARYAGVSADAIARWVHDGSLRVVKTTARARRWRFTTAAIDAAIRANEAPLMIRPTRSAETWTPPAAPMPSREPTSDLERRVRADLEAIIAKGN